MPDDLSQTGGTCRSLLLSRGRSHDGLVNCVRAAMSKSVSEPRTFVAANAILITQICGARHVSKHVRN